MSQTAHATSDTRPPLEGSFARAVEVVEAAKLPGELVIVDIDGRMRDAAFGLAERDTRTPNKIGQRWLWASVTKQVTATLVMQELDRQRVTLDAPLGTYLPMFGGDRAITIRELLQHRSGLPNPSDDPGPDGMPAFYREYGAGITNMARARGFCAGPAKRPRSGNWEYNNCDYFVLGAVLESVSGESYAQLIESRLARPLRLRSLRLARDGEVRAASAAVGYDGAVSVPRINVATGGAAAGLTGTAADLARLDVALMDGRLLSAPSRAISWSGDPALGYMALGVWSFSARFAGCAAPIQIVERRGDFGGTQVRNVLAPQVGRAVVLFTNDAAAEFGEIWEGKGLAFELLSAALCPAAR